MSTTPFGQWLLNETKPGPRHRCPSCKTASLRIYEEKVICTNRNCPESPLRREN